MTDDDWELLLDVLKWRGVELSEEQKEYYRDFDDPCEAQHEILENVAANPYAEALTLAQRNRR